MGMIRVENTGKRFPESGEDWVFRGVDFEVARGESFVVVGPSGGGKSVLLKLVANLLDPTEGRVSVESTNVGMLFQKNALFDSLTSIENLLFPLKERLGIVGAEARARSTKMLEAVGLQDAADRFPDALSGGMQKRLGIARALIVEPEVILYDDPTAGLDPITSRTIIDLILHLRRERGSTLLSITNDMNRAYQLGDRIALLAQGRLTVGGTPAQVREAAEPALRQFIFGLTKGPLS